MIIMIINCNKTNLHFGEVVKAHETTYFYESNFKSTSNNNNYSTS